MNAQDMKTVLIEVMADLSCLEEDPGYNGSRLIIDDSQRDRLLEKLDAVVEGLATQVQPG